MQPQRLSGDRVEWARGRAWQVAGQNVPRGHGSITMAAGWDALVRARGARKAVKAAAQCGVTQCEKQPLARSGAKEGRGQGKAELESAGNRFSAIEGLMRCHLATCTRNARPQRERNATCDNHAYPFQLCAPRKISIVVPRRLARRFGSASPHARVRGTRSVPDIRRRCLECKEQRAMSILDKVSCRLYDLRVPRANVARLGL